VKTMVSTLPRDLTIETAYADLADEQLDQLIEAFRLRLLEQRQQTRS
jgi:hypothetical protein